MIVKRYEVKGTGSPFVVPSYKVTVTATTDSSPAAVHEADILLVVSDT